MIRDFSQRKGFTIEAEVISRCNFNCCFCNNRYGMTKDDGDKFKLNLENLKNFVSIAYKVHDDIELVLNGGEPTLHDSLLDFCICMNMMHKKCKTHILTNLSAPISLYVKLAKYASIVPTFHHQHVDHSEFIDKLNRLGISSCIVPVSSAEDLHNAKLMFGEKISLIPLLVENKKYSLNDMKPMMANKSLFEQIKIKMHENRHRMCISHEKYIYVNGDGYAYRCMFNQTLGYLFNIASDETTILNKLCGQTVVSCNNFCHYNF